MKIIILIITFIVSATIYKITRSKLVNDKLFYDNIPNTKSLIKLKENEFNGYVLCVDYYNGNIRDIHKVINSLLLQKKVPLRLVNIDKLVEEEPRLLNDVNVNVCPSLIKFHKGRAINKSVLVNNLNNLNFKVESYVNFCEENTLLKGERI